MFEQSEDTTRTPASEAEEPIRTFAEGGRSLVRSSAARAKQALDVKGRFNATYSGTAKDFFEIYLGFYRFYRL